MSHQHTTDRDSVTSWTPACHISTPQTVTLSLVEHLHVTSAHHRPSLCHQLNTCMSHQHTTDCDSVTPVYVH